MFNCLSSIQVVHDDKENKVLKYAGSQWKQTSSNSSFQRTLSSIDAKDIAIVKGSSLPSGYFNVSSIIGFEITIYGTLTSNLTLRYIVDNDTPGWTNSFTLPKDAMGSKANIELLRTSGSIHETFHSLTMIPISGILNIDFVTYIPSSLTSVYGRDIIVDDQNLQLDYSGHWVQMNANLPSGVGYRNTMTSSNSTKSSFSFPFFGSSVSVYGILQNVEGELIIDFSVDRKFGDRVTVFNGSQAIDPSLWTFNTPLWQLALESGAHTVYCEVYSATGSQAFNLDYIVYNSSSDTIEPIPIPINDPAEGKARLPTATIVGVICALVFGISLCVILYKRCTGTALQNPSISMTPRGVGASATRPDTNRLPEYDAEAGLANPPPPYSSKKEEEEGVK